jgi:hypothetical protein
MIFRTFQGTVYDTTRTPADHIIQKKESLITPEMPSALRRGGRGGVEGSGTPAQEFPQTLRRGTKHLDWKSVCGLEGCGNGTTPACMSGSLRGRPKVARTCW